MNGCCVTAMALALQAPAAAQSPAEHIARGDSLSAMLQPRAALIEYQRALVLDSTAYAAWWKAAEALLDVGRQDSGSDGRRRDSLYLAARAAAEAAIRVDAMGADGHFALAHAVGLYARTRGGRERVRYGRLIYDQAAWALALDPRHDGAHHVLGAWHAEVKRLPGITRFFAKTLFGAGFLGRASWDSSTAHLERAVELRPDFIYHRLELAQVYLERNRDGDAREQLQRIATLPVQDVMDPRYREEAARLLAAMVKEPPGPSGAAGGAAWPAVAAPTRAARRTRHGAPPPRPAPAAPGAGA